MIKTSIYITLLAALLLLGSCASIGHADREAILRNELTKWVNFSVDGVVAASHRGMTLRKLFSLSKAGDELRLDVLDGGAFGINPEPLVSAYMGSYFALRAPQLPQLEALPLTGITLPDLDFLSDPETFIQKHGEAILRERKLLLADTELQFSDKLRLQRLIDRKAGVEMQVSYTAKGDPDQVVLNLDSNTSVTLLVDNISYGQASVQALPRPAQDPSINGLLQQLEELLGGEGDMEF